MALNGEKKEIHVLMVAFAAQGHMNPMLRFGKRLLSKGLKITFATTEAAREHVSQSTTGIGINVVYFSDGLSFDYDRKNNMDHFMNTIGKHGPINLSALIHSLTTKFSCIIGNPFVPWVPDVAAEHKIPCAMLWIQPCTIYAIYYRFYNNLNSFPTLTNPDITVELPGLPLLHTEDLPSFVLPSNTFSSFSELLAYCFQNMSKSKWVLANSFYELEKDVIDSMDEVYPIRTVGPLVPSALLGEDSKFNVDIELIKSEDTCIEWLNNQKPSSVIYISFGSIIDLSIIEMEVVAKSLENRKYSFLWVVKEGEEKLPLGFVEATKDQGLIVKWSPQVKVLEHPSIACFLTHCGWNSLLETITAGVPVIAYPQWTDQPTNAKLLDTLHVGVRLRRGEGGVLSGEEVENCMQEIMAGPRSEEIKKNAAELKLKAREAVASGGSSDQNIHWFVDEILANSC